jgi:hypothetical protein
MAGCHVIITVTYKVDETHQSRSSQIQSALEKLSEVTVAF